MDLGIISPDILDRLSEYICLAALPGNLDTVNVSAFIYNITF